MRRTYTNKTLNSFRPGERSGQGSRSGAPAPARSTPLGDDRFQELIRGASEFFAAAERKEDADPEAVKARAATRAAAQAAARADIQAAEQERVQRAARKAAVIEEIRQSMAQWGLSVADLD